MTEMQALRDAPLRERFRLETGAASGLVVRDDVAHVVADHGLRLQRYRLGGVRLPDVPPAPHAEPPIAKSEKPDLEALLDLGDGRLLAFGSGSRPNRERALLFDPAAGTAHRLDLAPLYARLREALGELNLEGAARVGSDWVLGNRGAGRRAPSALVRVDASAFPALAYHSWAPLPLPDLDGVPLHLTDLALHPSDGLHFLAVAEATDDAYEDAPCMGTVLGRLDAALRPELLARLRPDVKGEGLSWWQPDRGPGRWLVVADADDLAFRSPLYEIGFGLSP
jgi:hypothetical protein